MKFNLQNIQYPEFILWIQNLLKVTNLMQKAAFCSKKMNNYLDC